MIWVYIILGVYLLANLVMALIGFRTASKSAEDYFLAGRGVGVVILFFTFVATNFSAFFFLGFAGEGYRIGYAYYGMMAFGTAFAAISFVVIGFKVWKLGKEHGFLTPAELIYHQSGSRALSLGYSFVMVLFTLPYIALQPMGAGYILEVISDGQISYYTGVGLLTAFILVYIFFGGMRSVAITDMVQGVLMFVLMFVAVILIGSKLGGFQSANEAVFNLKPELFSREGAGGYFTYKKWLSMMILWTMAVPMFPQMFMRFYISGSERAFKTSTLLYAVIPLVLFICPVMIGVFGHLAFPGLEGGPANSILPMMLYDLVPAGVAALILVGALAAFMSTLDSQLLAVGTILARDVYKDVFKKDASFKAEIWAGRVSIILLALLSLFIAANPPDSIGEFVKQAFTGYSILFIPTLAVLYLRPIPVTACIVSIFLGLTVVVERYFDLTEGKYLLGFDPVVIISAIAVVLIGSQYVLMKRKDH